MGENGSRERIQRLCEKTGCSPQEAEFALEQGSLLDAVAYLEEQGQVSLAVDLGYFSTLDVSVAVEETETAVMGTDACTSDTLADWLKRELLFNQFQLWRGERFLCGMPVLLLLFLFPLTFGSLLPLLTLPVLLGIHYRFSYQGSFLAEFNPIMRRVTNTLTHLRRNLFGKFKKR